MSVPVFRVAGTAVFTANNVATPTTLAPRVGAGMVAGDLMLLVTGSRSNTATCATPAGWTLLTGFPKASGTSSGGTVYVFSRLYVDGTGNDAPSAVWSSLTTGTSGDSCTAVIVAWSLAQAVQDGTATVTDGAITTTATVPTMSTAASNALWVGIVFKISDTSQTWTIATQTERVDVNTQTGTGNTLAIADKVVAAAGATGTAAYTPSSTTSSRALQISLGMAAVVTAVTAADSLGTSDAATQAFAGARTTDDTLGSSEAATRAYAGARTTADSLSTSDTVTRSAQAFARTTTDLLGTSDAASQHTPLANRGTADALGTSDAAARLVSPVRAGADSIGTSDAAARSAQVPGRTGADSLGTSDVATRLVRPGRATADNLGTADVATRTAEAFGRAGADTLGTSDAAVGVFTPGGNLSVRTAADSLGTSDAATRLAPRIRTVADTLATSDAGTHVELLTRTATDELGTSDGATRLQTPARSTTDSLGTSDAPLQMFARTATDLLGALDSASRAPYSRARTTTDALGSSDADARIRISGRGASDSLDTSDAATATTPFSGVRTASDLQVISDEAIVVALKARVAADSFELTEAVARGPVMVVSFTFDLLGTSDSAFALLRAEVPWASSSRFSTHTVVVDAPATMTSPTATITTRNGMAKTR